jgi:hypothetical protein
MAVMALPRATAWAPTGRRRKSAPSVEECSERWAEIPGAAPRSHAAARRLRAAGFIVLGNTESHFSQAGSVLPPGLEGLDPEIQIHPAPQEVFDLHPRRLTQIADGPADLVRADADVQQAYLGELD